MINPLSVVLLLFIGLASSYVWPNYPMDELEHLLVDTGGFNDGGFRFAITPCTNYVSGSQLLGRETAAQWIRVAFHDFATADVAAGTGGIDASIGFETLRPENSGSAMNDSLAFFAPFLNAHRSMADLIALSVVMSVGGCSSPTIHIPLRAGRIDATEGGAFGVPEPETSIEDTLAQLKQAGFPQADAIGLTACGHTLGSVHHGGFPQVVNASAVTPTNQAGGIHFDTTVDVFDVNVVNEYLSGTGQLGGPLVTTDNATVRSDLRLYTSDNNATMTRLSSSSEFFAATCISLLGRMIDIVPSTTTLSEVIDPPEVKPVNISLSVNEEGAVNFSGFIRLRSTSFSQNATVSISWKSRNGQSSSEFVTNGVFIPDQIGDGIFGATYYHSFSTPIDPSEGISSFVVNVKDGSRSTTFTNRGTQYRVEDIGFINPSETTMDVNGNTVVNAAVLTSAIPQNVTAVFSIPSPQQGTLSPQILTSVLTLEELDHFGPYTIYSASTQLAVMNVPQTTVDLIVHTENHGTIRDDFNHFTLVDSQDSRRGF